jgi:hypothetical protein
MEKNLSPRQGKFTSSELAARWKIPARSLRDVLQAAGVDAAGGYDQNAAANALITHLKSEASRYAESRASAQNREQEAKAALAEINLQERLGNLRAVADTRFFITDIATTLRQRVVGEFPKEVAKKLCRFMSELRIPERAKHLRATCPHCRHRIFDELDRLEMLKKNEKTKKENRPQVR